jgi:2-polyprenyl-6-methoxyphenol hydroxylase-like FAD-dependent oxidoreductase
VSVGDAVASFNPIYGQGMSSAALPAACLAEFLSSGPDLRTPAREFFELHDIVVDAAWGVSADGDAAQLDAISGAEVPQGVSRQR